MAIGTPSSISNSFPGTMNSPSTKVLLVLFKSSMKYFSSLLTISPDPLKGDRNAVIYKFTKTGDTFYFWRIESGKTVFREMATENNTDAALQAIRAAMSKDDKNKHKFVVCT